MNDALKNYFEALNNIPKDVYLKAEISDCRKIMELIEKDLRVCQDASRKLELQEELENAQRTISNLENLLDSGEEFVVGIGDINTNM